MSSIVKFIRIEWGLLATAFLFIYLNFLAKGINPTSLSPSSSLIVTILIFIIMLIAAFNVVMHADWLAEKFGEPYGTLILTLTVISIEVTLIMTMMLIGRGGPTFARDTMFAVIMIAVNGFAGLSLIVGGLKHKEQKYNLEGASAYIAVIISLVTICLILPNYTISTTVGTLNTFQSVMIIIICMVLYATFLIKQTITHKGYFHFSINRDNKNMVHDPVGSISYHCITLVLCLAFMILLSKNLTTFLDSSFESAGLPKQLACFIIALLVLVPEGVSSIQSAYKNQLQRSINLCLGSAVATICLTIPVVLLISMGIGHDIRLGLDPSSTVLMALIFFCNLGVPFVKTMFSLMLPLIICELFILNWNEGPLIILLFFIIAVSLILSV